MYIDNWQGRKIMLFNVANLTGFVHATPARKLLKNCLLTPEFQNLAVWRHARFNFFHFCTLESVVTINDAAEYDNEFVKSCNSLRS